MVTIETNKLKIEIEHPAPVELLYEFREAIIYNLQHINYSETSDLKDLGHCNYFMLELLKQTLDMVLVMEKEK